MSEECIHGFADGLCATCNPKPASEGTVAARAERRSRVAAPPRATVRSVRAAARLPAASADALLEQRIYHLTHFSNLAGVIAEGALLAGALPELELSPLELREERREIEIPGTGDRRLSDYVSFFLSPEASLWQSLRDGREHPRLSKSARAADALEYVFLVTTVRTVTAAGAAFVLADGNAEGHTTRFATTPDEAERMLHRLRTRSTEVEADAELLISTRLPLHAITLIGVANDRVRQSVRDLLAGSSFSPKIAVYPPWFQSAG